MMGSKRLNVRSKFLIVFILLGFSISSYSQEGKRFVPYSLLGKVKIGVQYAYFNGGKYTNLKPGKSVGMDVSYFFDDRFFLTAHLNCGTNRYFEDKLTTYTSTGTLIGGSPVNDTNATLIMNNVGLLGGIYLPIFEWLNVSAQIGFSQFIEIKSKFPIKTSESEAYNMRHVDDVFFGAAFPVKLSIGFNPSKSIEIALAGGFYVEPDYFPTPYVGVYCGPQISVIF
jgi:hypothetical protein